MAYTPELSQQDSATLRRIAWALGMPMTMAMEQVMEEAARRIDPRKVCEACKDKTQCSTCVFGPDTPKNIEETK